MASSLLAGSALASIAIAPERATTCDEVKLIVTRRFMEDCQWKVEPTVRWRAGSLDVSLELKGEPACDQAISERSFEVLLGKLPAGSYAVTVRWSDGGAVEKTRLDVLDAPCADNRGGREEK